MPQKNLSNAKQQKKDEFYTQYTDIEKECERYREQFKDKAVYCNCDDPEESNFWHYFANNFDFFGLKKLITTHYDANKKSYKLELYKDINRDGFINGKDKILAELVGDGDFRNKECIEILKEADIVVTNPPFSLFREYLEQLFEYKKFFLIIGSVNAITYKECFKLIKENKMWLGASIHSGDREFRVPDDYPLRAAGYRIDNVGKKYIRVKGVRWFTNIDVASRHEDLTLYKRYKAKEYPKYDNYDAINVNKTADIPIDYEGIMGVPITFLDKYNPDQFEIMGITSGRDEFEARPRKRYISPKQHSLDGKVTNGSKANTRATLISTSKPAGIYYTADNADGYITILYARILIRNKKLGELK